MKDKKQSLSIEDRYWEVDFFADKLRRAGELIAERVNHSGLL